MIALYYYPGNASLVPHIILREIGVPFELRLVDRSQNAQQSPEYLKLNPSGRIPVLIDDGHVLFETAAIAMHLADKFPAVGLAPAFGTPLPLQSGMTLTAHVILERRSFFDWLLQPLHAVRNRT